MESSDSTSSESEIGSLVKFKKPKRQQCIICKKIGGPVIKSRRIIWVVFGPVNAWVRKLAKIN